VDVVPVDVVPVDVVPVDVVPVDIAAVDVAPVDVLVVLEGLVVVDVAMTDEGPLLELVPCVDVPPGFDSPSPHPKGVNAADAKSTPNLKGLREKIERTPLVKTESKDCTIVTPRENRIYLGRSTEMSAARNAPPPKGEIKSPRCAPNHPTTCLVVDWLQLDALD
jgi:hypothetical protein